MSREYVAGQQDDRDDASMNPEGEAFKPTDGRAEAHDDPDHAIEDDEQDDDEEDDEED